MRWRWSRAWWILDEAVRSATELAKLRGAEISMIFLEPMAALDPVYTIGAQIAETIAQHEGIGQRGRVLEAIPGCARLRLRRTLSPCHRDLHAWRNTGVNVADRRDVTLRTCRRSNPNPGNQ